MPELSIADAKSLMAKIFAPWIKELELEPVSFDQKGGSFTLPDNAALVHVGGVVCGQAIASAADTAIVVVLAAMNGRLRMCTTVDFTTHFIRPIPPGAVDIRVDVLSNGKRMAYLRVEFRAEGSEKLAATVTSTFAYLED
ncbi:MAG: PaaI family thioesterase [Rhizobiaceae bacterium]